ncbi:MULTISPECIES: protein TolQ [Methylovorus]|jgi:biopolymer transport protein TolQ|uniref:Tol-Pal system protein TolQ n=1 Tax=Methylovorus glucosotrophus (strain SIP3-4) TaxID=582744 RepID=C6XA98_METGS|nr:MULTISPECIES: protein TolQ [Methylovorus]ACT51639.1 protein TolQ [Methylovorus glucosotrophus SIP3-4]ADQ85484.1 protein TolQ [Methylovorus sp. MP688]KAF0843100.1 cell division and transport-associated protein TolQ [Methylovorus glucosotrophus]
MNLSEDMSLYTLIAGASVPVQIVMAILLLTSLVSWWYIFIKVFSIRSAERDALAFEEEFWRGGDLNKLYDSVNAGRRRAQGMASIFEAGFKEYAKLKRQGGLEISDVTQSAQRAMRASYNREMDDLDSHLPFLASVGSVSPYIGLFGTVWGIMNAFRGLSNMAQATLSHVAPGIAEALVATAIGLFAAIPAVIAYNRFASAVDRLAVRYESFMEEFTNILQRNK